jgi:hypothetical protein
VSEEAGRQDGAPEEASKDGPPDQTDKGNVFARSLAAFRQQGGLAKIAIGSATALLTAAVIGIVGLVGGWVVGDQSSQADSELGAPASLPPSGGHDSSAITVASTTTATTLVPEGPSIKAAGYEQYDNDTWAMVTDQVLPAPEAWPVRADELHAFLKENGGRDVDGWIRLTLEGTASRTVTIVEAHAEVIACDVSDPTALVVVEADVGGVEDTLEWGFDLDALDPEAGTYNAIDRTLEPYFRGKVLTLAPGEVVTADVRARSSRDCDWLYSS